jgi:hypothetical protein
MECDGMFDSVSYGERDIVMRLVAPFHFRNGCKNLDGSMGTIYITPGQLNDVLAYALSVEEGTDGS